MSNHTALTSRDDFEKALSTKGKLVLIYAYEGSVDAKAEECVLHRERTIKELRA